MANLLRLTVALLLLACGAAHAAIPKIQYEYNDGSPSWTESPAAACSYVVSEATKSPTFNYAFTGGFYVVQAPRVYGCNVTVTYDSNGAFVKDDWLYVQSREVLAHCPINSQPVGSACVCNDGYTEGSGVNAGQCVPKPQEDPCKPLAGQSAGSKQWWGDSDSFSFCDGWNPKGGGKCVAVATKDGGWEDKSLPPGHPHRYTSSGDATYTGGSSQSCNGDGSAPAKPGGSTPTDDGKPPATPKDGEATPTPCPSGQAAGSVNGSQACAPHPPGTPVDGKETTTKKNPDGSTTRTDEETRCNGVKCEKDTRVCKKTAEGLETCETTTTTSDQSGFCAKGENKGNKVCRGQGDGTPSGFGGNCDAGFIATGDDAVLNAMAQEQYKRNCELLRTDKEPSTWLTAEGQKTGNRTGDNPNNGNISIGPGNFDTSDALGGGGGCNLNKTITVRGLSVALPFDVLCDPLAVFGQILVAVSMLLAARIVTRG